MAYVDQGKKARIAAELKKVVPKGWKYSLAVRNYSTIVLTISAAPVDLVGEWVGNVNKSRLNRNDLPLVETPNYVQVNEYHLDSAFDKSLPVFKKIKAALDLENFDNSDIMTDYFNVGHYVNINLGKWDKPFVVLN